MSEERSISDLAAAEHDEASRLIPIVYEELRRVAASMLRRRVPLTIQPTALVHEAFMRLAKERNGCWNDESHFRALAALAMRRILIDHVRARKSLKRGGNRRAITMDVSMIAAGETCDVTALDDVLAKLEREHPRIAKLVIYRFFGELSVEQAATRLSIPVSAAEVDWRFAKAWIKRHLTGATA